MILMTDGQDGSDVAAQHDLAVKNGIKIYAIGVGDGKKMAFTQKWARPLPPPPSQP